MKQNRDIKGVNALAKRLGVFFFPGMNARVKEVRSKRFGSYLTQRFSAGIQLANETWVSKGVNALFKDSPLALIARHECLGEGGKRQPL
jgi:hypothetical protein